MKQTVISFMGLFIAVIICLSGCEKATKEESPETIAANLLKQGKAAPELLIGTWKLIKFAYTKDGNNISDRDTIPYSISCPNLSIPCVPTNPTDDSLKNKWHLYYVNDIWYNCSLNNHFIELSRCGQTMVYSPKYSSHESKICAALNNAYSFVIMENQLIIYFKKGKKQNLLILEKI